MAKRMLDCVSSDFAYFTKEDFLSSIAGSEGRVLTCECIGTTMPLLGDQTNAELASSMGTDIHHLGDTGYPGVAIPENIMAYSIAIRGVRHTYHRMASSINRQI